MNLKEIINNYKNSSGMSNYDIADALNVSYVTVTRWLNGSVDHVQADTAKKLSHLMGYDITPLLNDGDQQFAKPILGYAKAGYNMFLDANYLGEQQVTYKDFCRGDYFLKVQGNSMINAGIFDGGLVYVKKCNQVENNQIAIVRVGDEVTIKRYIKRRGGLVLKAENPNIEDRFYTKEEIQALPLEILGKVLYYTIDLE